MSALPPNIDLCVCLCVCGVCRGLGWAGEDLSILGRCKRSKLCNMMVTASQVMVNAELFCGLI